jgi:inner membrane protein
MASAFSHAVVALALGRSVQTTVMDRRALLLGAFSAVLPDLDVLGMYGGIEYGALWGHRGLTHSVCFALLWGALVAGLWYRDRWIWLPSLILWAGCRVMVRRSSENR